jgi:hypothetical protein
MFDILDILDILDNQRLSKIIKDFELFHYYLNYHLKQY